jgi:hypothetical protein
MGSTLLGIFILCCKCAVLAALIVMDIPLTMKVLMGVAFFLMWVLLFVLGEIHDQLKNIHFFARLTYTATEMQRTEPGNQEFARDRITKDVLYEKGGEGSKIIEGISWGLELGSLAVGTFVFYFLFQIIK